MITNNQIVNCHWETANNLTRESGNIRRDSEISSDEFLRAKCVYVWLALKTSFSFTNAKEVGTFGLFGSTPSGSVKPCQGHHFQVLRQGLLPAAFVSTSVQVSTSSKS